MRGVGRSSVCWIVEGGRRRDRAAVDARRVAPAGKPRSAHGAGNDALSLQRTGTGEQGLEEGAC